MDSDDDVGGGRGGNSTDGVEGEDEALVLAVAVSPLGTGGDDEGVGMEEREEEAIDDVDGDFMENELESNFESIVEQGIEIGVGRLRGGIELEKGRGGL